MTRTPQDQPDTDFPKIGTPARNALIHAGYTQLAQLDQVREADIKNLHGMGPKALEILKQAMAEKGLAFAKSSQDDPATDFPKTSGPAQGALFHAGYTHLAQLAQVTEADIKNLHGMGPKAMGILKQAMADRGLSFAEKKK